MADVKASMRAAKEAAKEGKWDLVLTAAREILKANAQSYEAYL